MITTIIPTYRRPQKLLRAIRSVQNQNIDDSLILVLDNCSEDQTRELVLSEARNDSRICYVCHSTNIGPFENFKYGYNQVQTPFFSFLSDDDLLLPGFYKKGLEALEQYAEAAFYACSSLHTEENGRIFWVSLTDRSNTEFHSLASNLAEYAKGDFPVWTSILFQKKFCDAIGGLPNGLLHDEEFVLKLILRFPYILSNHPGAVFFRSLQSTSAGMKYSTVFENQERLIDSIHLYSDVDESRRKFLIEWLKNRNQWYGSTSILKALQSKDFQDAELVLEILKKSYPMNPKIPFYLRMLRICRGSELIQKVFSLCCLARLALTSGFKKFRYKKFTSFIPKD